jgi:hypothetical protein
MMRHRPELGSGSVRPEVGVTGRPHLSATAGEGRRTPLRWAADGPECRLG